MTIIELIVRRALVTKTRRSPRVVPRPPESQAGCSSSSSTKKRTSSVAAARAEPGGARRERFGCADVDAPRDGGGASGGPEHPLHRAPGPTPWRRALRAAFPRGVGHPLAPNLRRGRHALHRVRRTHDDARGRDGPRVHRPPSSSDRGISATACSGSRHRAAVMRAIPHYACLLPMPVNASNWSVLRSSICNL